MKLLCCLAPSSLEGDKSRLNASMFFSSSELVIEKLKLGLPTHKKGITICARAEDLADFGTSLTSALLGFEDLSANLR